MRDTDKARIVSLSPDVCLTPRGSAMVPVPYPIVDYYGHDVGYTPSVFFTGEKAMVLRSKTGHVHGDEPGTAKGVVSGTVGDVTEPIGHAPQVRAEGSNLVRHLDRFKMNRGNTVGEAIFVRDTKTYPAPKDTDPVPGSLRRQEAVQVAYNGSAAEAFALAQAQPAVAGQTAPAPGGTPGQAPPRPPGTVIRPGPDRAPGWHRPPPHRIPKPPISPGTLARLGVWARRLSPLGILSSVFIPTNGANLSDVVPQDAFERGLVETFNEGVEAGEDSWAMREWVMDELGRHRQAQRTRPQAVPAPQPGARIDEEGSQRRCLVGPYATIEPLCRGQAHHIVPDMAYRLGRRPTTLAEMNSTENRVPNAPTFNQGMSICLLSRQHGSDADGLHGVLRGRLAGLPSPVPGTARMDGILEESIRGIDEIPDLPAECKALAASMATAQVGASTGFAAPGRTRERPLPTGQARTVLQRGHY